MKNGMFAGRKARILAVAIVAMAGGLAATEQAAAGGNQPLDAFVASCSDPAPGFTVRDPEFNPQDLQATWQEDPILNPDGTVQQHGAVNVVPVDPVNGNFLMTEHQRIANCNPVASVVTGNGPEFGRSARGWEVFYSAYSADESTLRLARLTSDINGVWQLSFPPEGDTKGSPIASITSTDAVPFLYYNNFTGTFPSGLVWDRFGWRQDLTSPVDTRMGVKDSAGRWIPETAKLFHLKVSVNRRGEVRASPYIYDTVTKTSTALIPGDTRNRRYIFPWIAPELGNKPALATTVQKSRPSRVDLEVYKEDTPGQWVLWTTIESIDSAYPYIASPEPFVFKGRSYMAMMSGAADAGKTTPVIIWFTTVDPDLPAWRKVKRTISQELYSGVVTPKLDPEALVINGGNDAIIYYVDRGTDGETPQFLRCDTGL